MRRGELLNTMWQDIDFTKKIIHICPKDDTEFTWKRQIKNTDRRDAPITKELAESLSGYRAQQPAGYPYVFVPPKRYCRIQKARRPWILTIYQPITIISDYEYEQWYFTFRIPDEVGETYL